MTTREERLNALMNAGINTDDFISIMIPKSLKENQRIVLSVKDGEIKAQLDEVEQAIKADGYTACTKLYRRWICAQMLRILGQMEVRNMNFNEYVRKYYNTKYRLRMVEHECEVLAKLQKEDPESYEERGLFFTPVAITDIYDDYQTELCRAFDVEETHKCKGKPYKHIGHTNMFIEDFMSEVQKIGSLIDKISYTSDYTEIAKIVHELNKLIFDIGFDTDNGTKNWIEAFKGNGAYYTLKNLVLFHKCELENYDTGEVMKGEEAFDWMKSKLNEYEGYQWFALLKKTVKQNHVTLEHLF